MAKGFIYLRKDRNAYYIGKTNDMDRRTREYRKENAFITTVDYYATDDMDAAERELKLRCKKWNIFNDKRRNETLRLDEDVLEVFDAVKERHIDNSYASVLKAERNRREALRERKILLRKHQKEQESQEERQQRIENYLKDIKEWEKELDNLVEPDRVNKDDVCGWFLGTIAFLLFVLPLNELNDPFLLSILIGVPCFVLWGGMTGHSKEHIAYEKRVAQLKTWIKFSKERHQELISRNGLRDDCVNPNFVFVATR